MATTVNPDLAKERKSATFSTELMTNWLDGGSDVTASRRRIHKLALAEKEFTDGPDVNFLSREDYYSDAVRRSVHMQRLLKKWQITDPRERYWLGMISHPWDAAPDGLHTSMFLPTLENQTTEEQKQRWLPKALSREYLGTYAQTEMGHGTFIRGLETTATYDPKTQEFVIHTPKISAAKWWPGGLGKTSNCAVVMAQLISQGQNHGMHMFFIQLRDLGTHQPLPGITLGDIGPKFGYNSIDNGYLLFDNFRIPRTNMLMKYAEVLPDGTFVSKSKLKKANYSTMTMVRTFIVNATANALSTALTIAVRYSAVRRQSELKPGDQEPQIMDYQTQQYKLYPYLAMAYAFRVVASDLLEMLFLGMGAAQSGDDTMMPELHALSSGMKAYCSEMAALGVEQARFACGGHGYSHASGLPKLYGTSVPSVTYEGEKTILQLQSARYLMNCVDMAAAGKSLPASVAYLATPNTHCRIRSDVAIDDVIHTFEHRARRIIKETAAKLTQMKAKGLDLYDARNQCGIYLVRSSDAHCQAHVIKAFAKGLEKCTDANSKAVLVALCRFLAAYYISNNAGDFLEDGFMSRYQLQQIRDTETQLLAELRPKAVALVDAFDYPDRYLGSVLGRYDGNVYENLYKWAQNSPLNKSQVHESYYKYLQPMIKSKI